jgi:hypothetical protein
VAPAYRILKESQEVQFVSGRIPELHLRSSYTLQNYGSSGLVFVDVRLPNKERYGIRSLLVKVNGLAVTPVELSAESQGQEPAKFRIPFDPAWSQTRRRDLVIEYSFASPEDSGTNIALNSASFYIVSRGWFPSLQPPNHVLSPFPDTPSRITYTVQVPADFLLLAPGKPVGRTKNGREIKYRFELRSSDPAPFIVAGRYVDSCSNKRSCPAVFWTIEPLNRDLVPAEDEIASTWNILKKNFGPLEKNGLVPHVVESPGLRHINDGVPSRFPFYGGVLVDPQAISLGVSSEDFLELVTRALADNWFGVEIYSPDSPIGITQGLTGYAVIVVDETRHGASARSARVSRFLREYDDACEEAVEKPLVAVTMHDPIEQRRIALAKAPLFFIALEDTYGEESVRRGLEQVVNLLRGQEVRYQDIRAALENVTNQDLAPIFRTWLYKPGIPAQFRAKYQGAPAGQN